MSKCSRPSLSSVGAAVSPVSKGEPCSCGLDSSLDHSISHQFIKSMFAPVILDFHAVNM